MHVPYDRSNWCTNFQLKNSKVTVGLIERRKPQEVDVYLAYIAAPAAGSLCAAFTTRSRLQKFYAGISISGYIRREIPMTTRTAAYYVGTRRRRIVL